MPLNRLSLLVHFAWLAVWLALPVPASGQTPTLPPAQSPDKVVEYGEGEEVGSIKIKGLRESSGLAASRIHPDLLWTHNDSGGKPRLFAIDTSGNYLATCTVKGASALDWEDIASMKIGDKPYLLIADCGDNQAIRKNIQLHLVPEVAPRKSKRDLKKKFTFRLKFADGAHDCESIGVDSERQELILITKSWRPFCHVYAVPFTGAPANEIMTAKKIGKLDLAGVTAMDIRADGRQAIVATYAHAYIFDRMAEEDWKTAFARQPREVELPARRQGESICFGHDGKTLYLTDERNPCPLFRVSPK